MLGWLLFALLGIIWTAFLLPRRHSSPLGSAKEFERTLHLLAETNRNVHGRWVLMPPKGRALDGGLAARRMRARRRRRLVFVLLSDGALITAVIGAFPRLRPMLYGTAGFVGLLVVYCGFLAVIATRERAQSRARTAMAPARPAAARLNGRRSAPLAFDYVDDDVRVIGRRRSVPQRAAVRTAG